MGEEKILVIEESFETEDFIVPAGYAVVIMPDAMATVTKTFNNNGDIYIFGGLYLEQSVVTASNYSNIILTGTLEGQPINHLQGGQISHQPYSPRKVAGHFPVTATSGWESYWERGITCGDDFYPMGGYYEDEACTKPITDLEAWQNGGGRHVDLGLKINGTADYNWEYWDTDEKQGFYYDFLTLECNVDFEADYDFTATGTFTFRRYLASAIGKWQSWYEPFDVALTAEVLDKMDAAEVAGILIDGDGNSVVAFKKMDAAEVMKANTPYVVRLKDPSGTLTLQYEDGMNIARPVENAYQFSSMYDNFEIGGIYTAQQNDDWYALSTSGAFSKLGAVTLRAQRLWLTVEPRTDSPYYNGVADARPMIGLIVLDDDTMRIEDLATTPTTTPEAIYDLSGQRATSLQRGQVYVVGGKKFMAQ